jgi:7-carboxy-7-deazaguanine synthase
MKKILISEKFLSIEGEGPYTGVPTFYIRTVGCNFKCSGFNNPEKKVIMYNKKGFDSVLGFDPAEYKTLEELPPINIGCDTIYSISDTRFKHFWKKVEWEEALDTCPTNVRTLSITGGEPSLWQDEIAEFLLSGLADRFDRVIFETNGSKELNDTFIDAINSWAMQGKEWVWSNSPKMECSGHCFEEAIRPEVIKKQTEARATQYFKFVTDASKESIYEILRAIGTYRIYGIQFDASQVYLMPMACSNEQQHQISQKVATLCIENGWRYCHRVQLEVYGSAVGT